jgi:hypothetical protein
MKPFGAVLAVSLLASAGCGGSSGDGRRIDARRADDAPLGGRDGGLDSHGAGDFGAPSVDVAQDGGTRDGGKVDAPWLAPDSSNLCHVDVAPVTPATLINLTAGPTALVRVQGTPIWGETVPFAPIWTWSVVRSDGKAIETKPVGADGSQIQFAISVAGRYDIAVDIGGNCGGNARALVQDSVGQLRLYHLRALPPASVSPAVPYEADVRIAAGSTSMTKDIELDRGALVTIDPSTGPSSALPLAVPSYIRVQSSGSTWVTYGRSNNSGAFRTVLDLMLEYQVLVVPDPPGDGRPGLPPYLLSRATANNVKVDAQYIGAYANPLPLPPGIRISGRLTDPDGAPAEGATINLHSYQAATSAGQTDLLFSTVGRAASDGSYALQVNPAGAFSIVVTPPPGSSLPTASIEQAINLTDATTVVPEVDFQWLPPDTTDLHITVTAPNGGVPPSPIAARVQSSAGAPSPPLAGRLTIAGDADGGSWTPGSALATVRREGTTDGTGRVAFDALPKGRYEVTLVPPASLGWAITKYNLDAGAVGGSLRIGLKLAPKVMVIGQLLDAKDDAATDTAGATVVATDLGTDTIAPIVKAEVSSDGSYVLALDPERTYSLVAQPVPGRGLPSYVPLYGFTTGKETLVLDDQRIPKGVLVQGQVSYAGVPTAGAVVQAFCVGLLPDCVDRTNLAAGAPPAFASTVSDDTGKYAFYLPDPATE